MILSSTSPYALLKSFKLLVAYDTTSFFVVVPLISVKGCRYEALCVSIRENGWRHHLFATEVGARGYSAYNVRSCFRRLGLNTKETKVVLSELTSTAIQCSFIIWLNRDNKIWNE